MINDSLTISRAEVVTLIDRAEKGQLQSSDGVLVAQVGRLVLTLWQVIDQKKVSIARLRKLLFGPKSEKRTSCRQQDQKPDAASTQAEATTSNNGQVANATVNGKEGDCKSQSSQQENKETSPVSVSGPLAEKKKRRGHGRIGADKYSGAEKINCINREIRPGDNCPKEHCCGHLYDTKDPQPFIRMEGSAIVDATNYVREVLRCTKCEQRFTAQLPEGIKHEKFDVTADVSIVMHHYGASMPFNRMAGLQALQGIPLPPSTQWERAESVADKAFPIYRELERQAAKSDVLHNDDTSVRILSLIKENKELTQSDRKGMHTTGVGARSANYDIVLYFSGRKYSAENLAEVLKKRPMELGQPLVVADAENKNWPSAFKKLVIKCLCLVHGRRQFIDCEAAYPEKCKKVLDELAKVYDNDEKTKGMTPQERLAFHQQYSKKIIDDLKSWIDKELLDDVEEQNGTFGKALEYMQTHWEGLTRFLQYGQAPLDNNHVERLLRKAVIFRKNSLFYRTEHGAVCGDILMSILNTCALNRINAFKYLVSIVKNAAAVRANPSAWLPWTYGKLEKPA
jgi:transposase